MIVRMFKERSRRSVQEHLTFGHLGGLEETMYTPTIVIFVLLALAPQPSTESKPDPTPSIKVGLSVVFTPGTYRKAEVHYQGDDPRVRFTVEDPAEFRQMEDSALRPVKLTKKRPKHRLPSGYPTTAVPIYSAGRVLELKESNSEFRNITPMARVEVLGGPLGGKKVWVRQSALAPQQTEIDSALKRAFADWAKANREAEDASRKLPAGNKLRKVLGRVKEVEAEIRATPGYDAPEIDVFLNQAIRDLWPTYSPDDFSFASYALRPSSQAAEPSESKEKERP